MKKILALLLALAMVGITCFALAEEVEMEHVYTSEDVYDGDGNWIGRDYFEDDVLYYSGRYQYDSEGNNTGYTGYSMPGSILDYKTVNDPDTGVSTACSYDKSGNPTGVSVEAYTEDAWQITSYDPEGHITNGYGWDYETGEYYIYNPESGTWVDYDGNEVSAADLGEYFRSASGLMSAASTWFSNNTVGVAGVALKTLNPDLTDKWYNVVPVDLSQDGTQVFPLVAGNHYLFGSVKVTVAGDEVTATYSYPDHFSYDIFPGDECLAWFTGVDQITSEFLDAPASETAFGTAVSKANDLNGQDTALLFVCNHVSYRLPLNNQGASLREYHPNTPGMAGYFDNATALMEKLGN